MCKRSDRQIRAVCELCCLFAGGLCLLLGFPVLAQHEPNTWHRVYTGEESVIELNTVSVKFDDSRVLRMNLRTVLEKEESLRERPGAKYKTRLETVEFKLDRKEYRLIQVDYLDSAGKTINSYKSLSAEWKPVRPAGMMDRLFYASQTFLPFGKWKVVSYSFAEGGTGTTENAAELNRLIGTPVLLEAARARIDESVCTSAAYKSSHLSIKELSRRMGMDIKLSGLHADEVEIISIKCESGTWEPPQSLLIELREGGILMLWKGVFLTLKKE